MNNKKITFIPVAQEAETIRKVLNKPLTECDFSVRVRNVIQSFNDYGVPKDFSGSNYRKEHIYTIGDLAKLSEVEILRTPNCGRITLNEFKTLLRDAGVSFSYEFKTKFMIWKLENIVDDDLLPGRILQQENILKFFDDKKYDEYSIIVPPEEINQWKEIK
jgi:hypothetical protein